MDAILKIYWRFCTTALRQELTRLRWSVGVLSMGFCQWALRFTAYLMELNSFRWWSVLGEHQEF
jgi:hypothetical protein